MKTQSTDLTNATDARAVAPFWLIEIDFDTKLRYNTAESSLTYNGNVYTIQDFRVSNLVISTSGAANAVVAFQGVDNTFTALFRQEGVEGTTVRLFKSAKQTGYGNADDAVELVTSTIDSLSLNSDQVILRLGRQPIYPNKRVDRINGFVFVTAAGSVDFPAGSQALN